MGVAVPDAETLERRRPEGGARDPVVEPGVVVIRVVKDLPLSPVKRFCESTAAKANRGSLTTREVDVLVESCSSSYTLTASPKISLLLTSTFDQASAIASEVRRPEKNWNCR